MPIGMAATFDEENIFNVFTMVSDEARAKYHDFLRNNERENFKGITFCFVLFCFFFFFYFIC
jgi:beta-glucosidase